MKFLIVSDIHIGVRGDSSTYLNIFENWFDNFLITNIKDLSITHLLILGDLFDSRNSINSKSKDLAIRKFDELVNIYPDLKIFMLVGNHDIYYKSTRSVYSTKVFENRYDNLEIINDLTVKEIGNRKFVFCPWIIEKEESDKLFEIEADVCFGHFEINGFQLVRGVVENHGFSRAKFKKNFRKTFSGHFHIRDEENSIIYIGNPYHMTWNDYLNDKGCYVLDVKTLNHKFIENTISPKYEKIYYTKLKNKTENLDKIENNFIQLVIDEICDDKIRNKLITILEKKNPKSLDINDLDVSIIRPDDMKTEITKPQEYINKYISKVELPSDYSYDRLKLTKLINKCYDEAI